MSIVRIAILDMNQGQPNRGIRCIEEILQQFSRGNSRPIHVQRFAVRDLNELPARAEDFDLYVSSGGPGSPLDGEGQDWERRFHSLMDGLRAWNDDPTNRRIRLFAICHSFQLLSRYFGIGQLRPRRTQSLGIVSIHRARSSAARHDPMLSRLPEIFHAFDSRNWEVASLDPARMRELGAEPLAWDGDNDATAALTAVRFTPEIEGVQFHPEAEPRDIGQLFREPAASEKFKAALGQATYDEQLRLLEARQCLQPTYDAILPGFLTRAMA